MATKRYHWVFRLLAILVVLFLITGYTPVSVEAARVRRSCGQTREQRREQQMNYLRLHANSPTLQQDYTAFFKVSVRTFHYHRRLAQGPPEQARFRGNRGRPRPVGITRRAFREVYGEADAQNRALSVVDIHREVVRRVHLVQPHTSVTLNAIRGAVAAEGHTLRAQGRVMYTHDPDVNRQRNEAARRVFPAIQAAMAHGKVICAMDESSLQPGGITRRIRVYPTRSGGIHAGGAARSRSTPVNMMGFFGMTGFYQCYVSRTPNNGENFSRNLLDFLADWAATYGSANILLLLDNCPIHRVAVLEDAKILFSEFSWEFLPRYSPDTKPIEFTFPMFKHRMRSRTQTGVTYSDADWQQLVDEVCLEFPEDPRSAANIFYHAFRIIDQLQYLPYADALAAANNRRPQGG